MGGQLERGSRQLSEPESARRAPGHFLQMQLAAEKLTTPVRWAEGRQTKIGVVNFNLAPPVPRRGVGRFVTAHAAANNLPRRRCHLRPCSFQFAVRPTHVGHQRRSRAPSTSFNHRVTFSGTARIAIKANASERAVNQPEMALGISRQVIQHVPNRPAGQQTWLANRSVP